MHLREVAQVFFKLGVVGFGGPAAHIAMMEEEVVERRGWLTRQHFLDLVGLTNLIPGPNSTEMAIHLGYLRAGWRGLIVAGVSFLTPAILITLGFAWVYARYGTLPAAQSIAHGIQPAVFAVICAAGWRLGKTAVKTPVHALLGVAIAIAVLAGVDILVALFGGALLGTLMLARPERGTTASVDLGLLFLTFLKVGAVLYGSGYVLVAFLQDELVDGYGWLTHEQLLDAIAVGQFTPGPVLSTATFIGYQVAGAPGALVATAGIFLPSFVIVALFSPIARWLRASPWAQSFLAAVRIAAVALLLAVLIQLSKLVLRDALAIGIATGALVATIRFRISAPWLVLAGGLLGLILN